MIEIKNVDLEGGPFSYMSAMVGDTTVEMTGLNSPGHRSLFLTQPEKDGSDDIIWMPISEAVKLVAVLQKGLEMYDEYDEKNA